MATITTRSGKGSPLTNTEVDNNFTNLNTAKYESGDSISVSGFNFTAANPSLNITANTSNWAAVNIQAGGNQANYIFFRDADAERARMTVLDNNDFSFSTGSNVERLKLSATAAVFNEPGNDVDFRIESDVDTAAFFVNGENSKVGIRNANPSYLLDVSGSSSFPNGIRFIQSLQDITDGNDHRGVKVTHNRYEQSGGTMNATGTHIGYDYDLNTGGSANATISGDTYGVRVIRSMGSGGNTTGTNYGYFYNSATYGSSNGATYAFYVSNVKPDGGSGGRHAFYNADQSATSTFEGTNIFNESSNATDFRVESNGNSHMLYVEGATDRVAIGHNDPAGILDVYKAYSNSETPKGIVLRDNTTTSNVALPGIWWSHSGDRYRAAIRAENDGPYGRKSISFWTSSTASWSASESDMKKRAIVKDHGDFEVVNDTAAATNSQNLPGRILFRGRGWNTSVGDENINITMQMSGAYTAGRGQTDPEFKLNVTTTDASNRRNDSTVFHIYPTDNNADNYVGNFYNGLIVNETSSSLGDFRVESDAYDHMLFVDASEDYVGIRTSSPAAQLDVNGRIAARTGDYGTYNTGILEITSGASNPQVKITTNIPYSGSNASTHAHTVKISGFNYGTSETCNLQICWHVYAGQFYARCASSSGGFAPEVTLAVENNYVVIHLGYVGYWPKLYVESMYNAYGGPGHAQDWTWSDAAVSADANTPNQTVAYRTDLGGGNDIGSSGAVFNETGADQDFRVESDSQSNMLYVDAGGNQVHFARNTFSETQGGATIRNDGLIQATRNGGDPLSLRRTNNYGQMIAMRWGTSSNTVVGSVDVSSSGITYNTTSDRRLKENIEPLTDGTDKLMAMNPVTHTWIERPEAGTVQGFIAQEMLDVCPEAVSGSPDGEEMMSMDYGRITPVLVAALQDAHKKIAELEARLNTLEGN